MKNTKDPAQLLCGWRRAMQTSRSDDIVGPVSVFLYYILGVKKAGGQKHTISHTLRSLSIRGCLYVRLSHARRLFWPPV